MPRKGLLPDYAVCADCTHEWDSRALRIVGSRVVCFNCADTRHRQRGPCTICNTVGPIEQHHVAGRVNWPVTIPTCLNCHAILSNRQRAWHPDWTTGRHPARFIVQGVFDCLTLWFDRSEYAAAVGRLFALIGTAALSLLPYLRLDALRIVTGITPVEMYYA